tara:strand:- start:17 stop:676 length:660 start_codon:yes stop_codon:yes gene_type:complete
LQILNPNQRSKIDESNDLDFYARPKFVYHLDSNFRKELTNIYDKEFCNNSTILDLMSSWDSYLPKTKKYKRVIGHGLNKEELERNKILDKYWIQNFNKDQNIPLENESIDYCLMIAAWQYLQYPENIATEISRILKNNGKLIIAFSNRAFWTKAPNIWTNSDENQRVDYVRNVLISNGFNEPKIIKKFVSNNFKLFPFFNFDPFYCLIAQKASDVLADV